jgi:uracil-DNA glycosylase family protein
MNDAPLPRTLAGLRKAEAQCTRCPLYLPATQVVPGEGPEHAPLMMVGEQPGNDEDLAGHPFVGPAGRMLDRAIAEAGLDRTQIYVTNAVKHFKFEPRGKRRLHKRPNTYEIERCKWWNDIERKLVHPEIIVALGDTAARSVMEKPRRSPKSAAKCCRSKTAPSCSSPSILRRCCASRIPTTRSENTPAWSQI